MTLTAAQIEKALKDPEHTAALANLVYVSDADLNIYRKKEKKSFTYYFNKKPLKNAEDLKRIEGLVIPPN